MVVKVILEEFVLNVYVTTEMASVLGFMEFSNLEFHENMKHCIVYCSGSQVVGELFLPLQNGTSGISSAIESPFFM